MVDEKAIEQTNIDTSVYDEFYFFPYREAPGYSEETPLYAFCGTIRGNFILLYDHPPENGAFHSLDPAVEGDLPHTPTEHLKTAFAQLLMNPGETHDLTNHLTSMPAWEHHFLETVMNVMNATPEELPQEIHEFLRRAIDSRFDFDYNGSVEDPTAALFGRLSEQLVGDQEDPMGMM